MQVLDRKVVRDVWRIRGPAAMIILVLACAVGTAVMAFSVLRSLAETRDEYYKACRFADLFATVNRAPESVVAAIERIPGIARVQTRLVVQLALDIADMDEPVVGRALSLPERGEPAVNAVVLRQGRTIATGHADEIIISETFASAHRLVPGVRIGAMLGGRRRELSIVGIGLSPEYIYAIGPDMIAPDDRRFGVLWMSRQALEAALEFKDEFNEASVQLDGTASAEGVREAIEEALKPYGGVGVYTRDQQTSHAFVSSMLDQLAGVGRIVPLIFLMVAGFLAHTIMGRLVDTERQHVGLFKALGMSDRMIGQHYLKLALVVTALGIGLGLMAGAALGFGLTWVYAQFFHFPFLQYRQDPAVSAAAGLAAAGAMIAGTYRGVRRAASLPSSIAMAPAMPPTYRRLPWEMIDRRLGEPTRMILRHVARWPLRAALAVVGLSLAVALQISMLFSFAALDRMIRFYGETQRQDVTVFFGEPQPGATAAAAARWPGVLKAEGYRTIPVQLTLDSRGRLVNLTTWPATATLSRLLDEELTPVPLPSSGVALSSKLARLLQAKVGDVLTVQPVGWRTQFKVPVAQLAEQYIGLDAYMDLGALNALVDDQSRITGVHLQIDPRQRGALYRTLKNLPGIAGVSERATVLASFQNTMARTLTIIVSVFVAFAGITAFGIVDSNTRIMLSERAREFATLHALGFSAREVAYIIIAELAVLVLLALPLGCVLGHGLGWLIARRLDTDLYRVPLVITSGTMIVAMAVVLSAFLASVWMIGRRMRQLNVLAMLDTAH